MLNMNKKIMYLIFAIALMAGTAMGTLFELGAAQKEYPGVGITCYLGKLFPGMPIYFCMNDDVGGMDHSYFVNQYTDTDRYYSGGMTTTFAVQP